jgi:hypothetical protein
VLVAVALPVAAQAAPSAGMARSARANEQPTDAKTLLSMLASVEGLEARFVEHKKLALLRAPLRSEGRIYFMRPGHLVRIVETPSASTVRIGPTSLEVRDASGEQRFDLRSRPDIKMFVESFVHVVAGNYDALASTYVLDFRPAASAEEPWLLTLTPKRKPLSELVERLEISGRGYEVSTIRVIETRGDSTEISLEAVDHQRRFSTEDQRRLFGLKTTKP